MDGPQEYEVESITRARVHGKRGKKITWKFYVKWKGYGWDESTWEPADSFQGGSEHILEAFWNRTDTGGRDITDATAFKKGEEIFISGPPGGKGLKRKANLSKAQPSPLPKNISTSGGVTISAPLPRKRRRVHTTDDEQEQPKPTHRVSTGNKEVSSKSLRRRRASAPGSRKQPPRRLPSAGDSQLDADGETDPDVVEVEDELMQVTHEDAEDSSSPQRRATASASANGSESITFEDLEHFYGGHPIDIDQHADEQAAVSEDQLSASPRPATVFSPNDVVPESPDPASPTLSSPDPLFDSPSHFPDKVAENPADPILPHHRARAANPLVKVFDATAHPTTNQQTRITAKARLMLNHSADVPSAGGPSRSTARRGGKPGPGRSSFGLVKKNRSSLLTASKGALKSIKGHFAGASVERGQPDEIEDPPVARDPMEEDKLIITPWSDEDNMMDQNRQPSNSEPAPPSGDELLKLALQTDAGTLPDYEEDTAAPVQEVEIQNSNSPDEQGLPDHLSVEVAGEVKASDDTADALHSVSETNPQVSTPVVGDSFVPPVGASEEAVKKNNIELAKEQLFPSTQTSFSTFSTAQPSFRSTIFGPLYQGYTRDPTVAKNSLSTFKLILGDGVELPLTLKDCSEIKTRISDILIGNSSGSKVALFYSAADALAMVSAFKSDGTARVVLDPSAEPTQQERFLALLQRFESSHTLIAPVGTEVCVLYSSENVDIAEKLGAPKHLRGLAGTLLISHASIENQLAYVAAAMQATNV